MRLWIAFKNYYLRDTTQRNNRFKPFISGCELLSKIIIFVTRHNENKKHYVLILVVNCFQKLLSSWHDTTPVNQFKFYCLLWIAFKNYYLRDTTQLKIFICSIPPCCELLSKIIIFVTRHNTSVNIRFKFVVVNCFQKLLSSWHDTTNFFYIPNLFLLWIAFKNYYLRDTTQQATISKLQRCCCELLSKIIIFVTRHNQKYNSRTEANVVNCFQKLLSSWHDTTYRVSPHIQFLLWIAFKNYYLRDTTQQKMVNAHSKLGCELLSKIIIFVTRHNLNQKNLLPQEVFEVFSEFKILLFLVLILP